MARRSVRLAAGLALGVGAALLRARRAGGAGDETPPGVLRGRQAATVERPMVVFLIGIRINRAGRLRDWLPTFMAMNPMLAELRRHPELGMIRSEQYLAVKGAMLVQYWRSVDDLHRFAHDRDAPHLPAWREFNRRARDSASVGVWHEAYEITPSGTEAVYVDMPAIGLGAATGLAPARGSLLTAARRMGRAAGDMPETLYPEADRGSQG
jgi:hypothetical protein